MYIPFIPYTVCILINKAHTIMIAHRVLLDITPKQAELLLESLRVNLARRTAENREDSSDNQRIRAVIATIKEQL